MSKLRIIGICLIGLLLASIALAQTATTTTLTGTVVDANGAVVAGATVKLINKANQLERTFATTDDGRYVFPTLEPGLYNLKVSATGFRPLTVTDVKLDVSRASNLDLKLEAGGAEAVVEVTATSGAVELQTTDATVGNVLTSEPLLRLPSLQRSAGEFLTLQPGVMPATGANTGGTTTGARSDQNTFSLDGIDVTDNSIGGGGNLRTIIPIPVDSVEEFRVGVANPNATFGRSAGAQVALVGRRGGNSFHGALYWYHQNDNLNAASWTNKRTIGLTETDPKKRAKLQEPEMKDNRFGGRLGGPIWKDKTFFFTNYEGRRFPQTFPLLRIVPSDTLRQGILRFTDGSGNTVSYNLTNSKLCGATGDQLCDPRAIGISPSVKALFGLYPAGNDPASGDGLNTVGFRSNASAPLEDDYIVYRMDHNFNDRWRFNGSYTYFRRLQTLGFQADIRNNQASWSDIGPQRGSALTAGLITQITPTLISNFRFGWVRDRNSTLRVSPAGSANLLKVTGTDTSAGAVALDLGGAATVGQAGLGGGILDEPIDVDTQRARTQGNDNRNFQFVEDVTWSKGNHTIQFGANIRHLPTTHIRDDKVVGSLASLVALLDDGSFINIPDTARPRQCGAGVTTNCLAAGDVTRWNRLYASTLGMIDNLGVLTVRDGQLKPLPFGTQLIAETTLQAYEFYAQDVWRMRPSITVSYGLAYQWQTPPKEKLGRQTFVINNQSKEIITSKGYLAEKQRAALAGQVFNPELAYMPINSSNRDKIHDIDWNNFGPRVAVAWNPSYSSGLFGNLIGQQKTVLRGGFGMVYDRLNTVQSVIIPMLGVGFAQTVSRVRPPCNATGAGGAGCNPAGTHPASVFRVGVDGSLPLPTVPAANIPVVPGLGFTELLSFQVDPDFKVGKNYSVDFTIQRELPGNMILEVGYAGRWGRNLNQSNNLSAAPIMHVDSASKQSFAQAFDAVATALREGRAVTPQPWFENQVPGGTASLVSSARSAFIDGLISDLFTTINVARFGAGLPTFNNFQVFDLFMRTDGGESNYHGMLVSLRKRLSRGFTFDLNYTLSKSLDQVGAVQNTAGYFPNPYNPDQEYGQSFFDRTHVFNATWLHDLPLGKGHRFSTGNWFDNVLGGWYWSGIFHASSGLPLIVNQGAQVFGGGAIFGFNTGAIPLRDPSDFGNEPQKGVFGANGVGTAGDPARRGSGINIFRNPDVVLQNFRRILLSQDERTGRSNPLRGFPAWTFDASLGKKTKITERVNLNFSFDFFNVFNSVIFNNPALNMTTPASFGVVTSQFIPPNRTSGSRWIQAGVRLEF